MAEGGSANKAGSGDGTARSGGGGIGLTLALPAVPTLAPAPVVMPVCHVPFPWRGALYPVM